jgi:glycosyltransferase involved in cell wall biosynthesis
MKSVSIVIPARNEEETLGRVLAEVKAAVKRISDYSFEVIVVADHCTDRTADIARDAGVICLENKRKNGKGYALISGFEKSTGDIIVMMDGDYSHNPKDLQDILKAFENGAGFVVASRSYGGSDEYETVRLFGNAFLTFVFQVMFSRFISDALNGYKAFVRSVFDNYRYRSRRFEIEIELLANALRDKQKIAEVPSHERSRAGGKMKSHAITDGTRFLLKILIEGLKYRLRSA